MIGVTCTLVSRPYHYSHFCVYILHNVEVYVSKRLAKNSLYEIVKYILSYRIVSYLILSYLISSYLILSYETNLLFEIKGKMRLFSACWLIRQAGCP